MEIEMSKQATDKYEKKLFFTKLNTITNKDQILPAILATAKEINEKIWSLY